MSQLEEIKARAETALLHENLDPSVYAELAWAVVPDVPKLAAALEAVEGLHYADEATEGTYPEVCVEGPCTHPDDCPEVSITP